MSGLPRVVTVLRTPWLLTVRIFSQTIGSKCVNQTLVCVKDLPPETDITISLIFQYIHIFMGLLPEPERKVSFPWITWCPTLNTDRHNELRFGRNIKHFFGGLFDTFTEFSNYLLLCVQIQNLGLFSVQDVVFRAEIWAVTRQGNQLVTITDSSIERVRGEKHFSPFNEWMKRKI